MMAVALCKASAASDLQSVAAVDSLPATWIPRAPFDQTLPVDDTWWKLFNDPQLTMLIEVGEKNNYDVAAAVKRIKIAQNALDAVRSSYYPTLSASAGWNVERGSGRTTAHRVESSTLTYFNAGVSMQWEIDLFGRVQEQARAQRAAVGVSRADYDATMVALAANIAKTYINLRMYQQQLEAATKHMESQQHIVDITEIRRDTGLASGLDVAQAKQVLLSTKATISTLQAGIRTSLNALCVLTGRYPGQLESSILTPAPLPNVLNVAPVGLPADILRRRPDVVEAELQLSQYAAQVGIARKDFLPAVSLTAEAGTQSHSLKHMFGSGSYFWNVAPQISWTIFDGLARNYRTTEAKLQLEAAVDNYNMVLLTAFQEVENAMSSYSCALETMASDKELLDQANQTLKLSLDLYKQGLTDFSNVASAQITILESRNQLIASQANALTALVTLYQALGGGWNQVVQPEMY